MGQQKPGWYPDPVDSTRSRWWDGRAWSPVVARDGAQWQEALPASPSPSVKRRLPVWAWILIGALALVPVLILSPVVVPIALVVLITAIVALSKGTRTWLRIGSRRAAIGVVAGSAAVLLVTGSVSAAMLPGASREHVDAAPRPAIAEEADAERPSPTPRPTRTPVQTTREEVVVEAVPFEKTTTDDPAMAAGQTQVRTPGQNGERTLTYRVHLVDGQEVGREVISDAVTTQPVTEVTASGTYVAPPPPPPAPPASGGGGCDSNYADACVPIASDVDCGGGSGDGPAYFYGVARVVGSDVYDLDRNNDGYACEP